MFNPFLAEIVKDFVSLIYPLYCEACEQPLVKGENVVCSACLLELPRSRYHLEGSNPLFTRLKGRIPIEHAAALFKFYKKGKVQHLLHAFKYKNRPEIGIMLGAFYGLDLQQVNYDSHYDVIVPVPLHYSRKRQRGYNQSMEFAKGLSESLKIPVEDLLSRVTKTGSQTRRTKLNRWENVNKVFEVKGQPVGKRILLVDDIITTGATVEACALKLLEAGCQHIGVVCIAATQ